MVLGGFLKKKGSEEKTPAKGDQAVPDELPPLGEETHPAQPEEEKAHTGQSAAPAPSFTQNEEPPMELPSLEEARPQVVEASHTSRTVQAAATEESEGQPDDAAESSEEGNSPDEGQRPSTASSDGFFAGISRLIREGRPVGSIISHDLLSNMKDSWGIKAESSRTGLSSIEEKKVGVAISETLTQLRLMESKWRAHKMILQEYEKLAREQEDKIKAKEKELKTHLKAFRIYQHVPEGNVIMLKDSIPVRSLGDLINALRTIDQSTFNVHVNKRRNDFSRLASLIDSRLGMDLRKAAGRAEMLRILEAFVRKLSE